jgi:AcrR family transcriptional regulator
MDDVAREAGVTRLIVYRIFESKHDLYRAVLEDVLEDTARSFENPPSPVDADDLRNTIVGVLLGVARRHPDGFRLLWRHAAHEPEFRDIAAVAKVAATEYALELLRPAMPDDRLRLWAAESLVAHLYESLCLWLDDGDPDRDDVCLALLVAGLRATVTHWADATST